MPTLRLETLVLPASDLGPKNPLPDLRDRRVSNVHVRIGPEIPEQERVALGIDDTRSCLPYRVQDGYDRFDRFFVQHQGHFDELFEQWKAENAPAA